ncbi:Lrp/AsnC family transcriptional regulator [Motiliproteus coralliicola]|uniref:siroheme decarboxylase subunit beta n=1 Tax=Motiliproteus coralliicola TaxID=2283196 RepID=UPI0014035184|nr:Lrp/AsnC family transcriptional regulator [Motiliproteus coralliicola]
MDGLTDQVVVSDNPEIEQLLELLQEGLPLVERPYAELGQALGWSEGRVIETMAALAESDRVRRMGIVVKHHALGFRANAMVVWDIPDDQVDAVAEQLAAQNAVTLCYQRPRRLPDWPYNLFCMIHGRQRDQVMEKLEELVETLGLQQIPHEPLFSTRCFKQCGGRYLKRGRPMVSMPSAHAAAAAI